MADDKSEEQPAAARAEYNDAVLEQMEDAVPRRSSPSDSEEKPVGGDDNAQDANEKSEVEHQDQPPGEEKKPSKFKQLWEKTGLDMTTLQMMFKGSLAPTIAIALYQSHAAAAQYQTLGYLVAISSILGFPIMPRGKFIQTMTLNVFAICLGAAVNLLALFCVTKARAHTTPPGPPQTYNAAASAVCGLWLVLQVYIINTVRAARPQFQFPAILCTIFVVVSMTYGTTMPNMAAAISFMERLLEAFLSGFGLSTAVSFLIFPMSSRKVVLKEINGYLMLLNGLLKTQTAYMASLERVDTVKINENREGKAKNDKKSKRKRDKGELPKGLLDTPASVKLREMMGKLLDLHTKLHGDITPAKREIAIGKLESHDFTELWKLLRGVFVPVLGLSSMISVLERQAEYQGWDEQGGTEEERKKRHDQLDGLHFLMKELHGPFSSMTATLDGAFQHVLITLELVKPEKKKQPDEESKGDRSPKPGSAEFAEAYKKKVDEFYSSKQKTLKDWCHEHGIELPPDFFESSFVRSASILSEAEHMREHYQRQLFFTLFLEYLLWRVAVALLDLVLYVDKRKQDGAFKSSKVIFPGSKTLYKWLRAVFGQEDFSEEDSYTTDMDSGGAHSVYLGQEFGRRRDPEHLPPSNILEKLGSRIRLIPKFFRSESSAFGLRVTAATMSVGIICYLRDTQTWFLQQRLLWAMIMIALSMNRTAGQSIFNFVLRVLGTAIAMVGAYIIWYIVDGKAPGVIVFLWLWIFMAFYIVIKMPKFVVVGILSLVTAVLIIGYELQVQVLGVELAESNGQPAYPTYLLAPYRLATVAGGLFIAFIWTIFPYPISESTELRKDLSASLYLMSSYYSIVRETVQSRIQGIGGDEKTKGTHGYHLDKARTTVFSKLGLLLNTLKTNAAFSKFQLNLGGKFPREEFEELIDCLQRLMLWTSLASYSSMTFQAKEDAGEEQSNWTNDFRRLLSSVNVTANKTTSLLSLLSSSLSNAQPLPPYLDMPEPFQFVKQIESIDKDILSIRHIAQPEYSAFAVMQIVSQCINTDVALLTKHVKNLVGEIDFSFHMVKSSSVSSSTSSSTSMSDEKGKVE